MSVGKAGLFESWMLRESDLVQVGDVIIMTSLETSCNGHFFGDANSDAGTVVFEQHKQ